MKNLTHIRKVAIVSSLIIIFTGLLSMCALASEKGENDKDSKNKVSLAEVAENKKLNIENEILLGNYFDKIEELEKADTLSAYEFYNENNELIYKIEIGVNEFDNHAKLQSMITNSDRIMDLNNTSLFVFNQ